MAAWNKMFYVLEKSFKCFKLIVKQSNEGEQAWSKTTKSIRQLSSMHIQDGRRIETASL